MKFQNMITSELMRNTQERLVYLCIAMDKQKQLTKVKIDLKRNFSPSYNKL